MHCKVSWSVLLLLLSLYELENILVCCEVSVQPALPSARIPRTSPTCSFPQGIPATSLLSCPYFRKPTYVCQQDPRCPWHPAALGPWVPRCSSAGSWRKAATALWLLVQAWGSAVTAEADEALQTVFLTLVPYEDGLWGGLNERNLFCSPAIGEALPQTQPMPMPLGRAPGDCTHWVNGFTANSVAVKPLELIKRFNSLNPHILLISTCPKPSACPQKSLPWEEPALGAVGAWCCTAGSASSQEGQRCL